VREEDEINQMRLQIGRRREIIQKKEINIMEWAKRNLNDRQKMDEDKAQLDAIKERLEREEQELNDKLRRMKKREFDELAKKAKIVEEKREILKNLKNEEITLNT
jgi:hypothetical protein